jgi:TRAP-type C4-dicarboxylate transport system substrate-binding protein
MKTRIRIHIVATVIALAAVSLPAATGRLILGMVLPANTMWHKVVTDMADDWRRTTDGRVAVVVRSGAGEEATILQKMRNDVYQLGALSVIGLTDIDQAFEVFTIPMFFESYGELYKVAEALTPLMKARLEKKGFVLLCWGHGGWVQVFSTKPIRSVGDLKSVKLFTSAGDDEMVEWYKRNGFHPQALAVEEVMMMLQTGGVDAVPTTPLVALSLRWYGKARHMLKLGLAPVVGATIMTRKAWDELTEADRGKVLEAARRMQERLEVEVPKQDEQAIAAMQKHGLTVVETSGPVAQEWRRAAEDFARSMRGSRVEPEVFDQAVRARDEYRQRADGGGRVR